MPPPSLPRTEWALLKGGTYVGEASDQLQSSATTGLLIVLQQLAHSIAGCGCGGLQRDLTTGDFAPGLEMPPVFQLDIVSTAAAILGGRMRSTAVCSMPACTSPSMTVNNDTITAAWSGLAVHAADFTCRHSLCSSCAWPSIPPIFKRSASKSASVSPLKACRPAGNLKPRSVKSCLWQGRCRPARLSQKSQHNAASYGGSSARRR